jgi:hypothetical protein
MFLRLAPFLVVALSTGNSHVKLLSKRCTGIISSLSDVAKAVTCTTVNIKGFTVSKGTYLVLRQDRDDPRFPQVLNATFLLHN